MPNTTTNTSNRAYPLPAAGNDLAYDVAKIITALTAIDADVATAFAQIAAKAGLNNPAFTGTPTAPTAAPGTNTGQLATTAFVVAAVNALVNSSPGALDTLNELAAALGNDPNFATTVTNAIAGKLDKSGGTLTGALVLAADPSANMNPATKQYVDSKTVLASQAEAEAGTDSTKLMTPLRTKQAINTGKQAYIHVRDQKAASTDGGTSSVGINVRALNTVVHNGITGASLASNKVTLPAGTYAVQARVPAYGANRHHAWLRTDTGTILAIGGGQYASSASGVSNDSVVQGKFTLAAQANLEVAHYFSSGLAANGLGTAGSSGSIAEVYTDMIIARLD